ncbi:MAG: hypothetical protein ACUVQQ_09650 [Thermogutta sp.]
MHLSEGCGDELTIHLQGLRFTRMLEGIMHKVLALFHDGTISYAIRDP